MDVSRSLVNPLVRTKFSKYLERAISISEKYYGPNSTEHGQILVESFLIFSQGGQIKEVKKHLEKGYSILSNNLGEMHPRTGIAAYNLGRLAFSKQQYSKSVDYLETALKTFEQPEKPSNAYELRTKNSWSTS